MSVSRRFEPVAQKASEVLFIVETGDPLALDRFEIVAGTEPSYNNLCDLDRLLQTLTHVAASFEVNRGKSPYAAVGVKHGNACGAAIDFDDPVKVVRRTVMGDPLAGNTFEHLSSFLTQRRQAGADTANPVIIAAQPGVRWRFVIKAMDVAVRAGFTNVQFAVSLGGGTRVSQ